MNCIFYLLYNTKGIGIPCTMNAFTGAGFTEGFYF